MRFIFFLALTFLGSISVTNAQSVTDNLPQGGTPAYSQNPPPPTPPPPSAPTATPVGADLYTVGDVNADVTADNASHARDQALMQAERNALSQLFVRLNAPDTSAKMDDDSVAALVQSFEVQSERLSAVRYIGVFTIRFKPSAVQKRFGKYVNATNDASLQAQGGADPKPMPSGPLGHLVVAVQTDSLASWTQIKKRMAAAPLVAKIDLIDLGRGLSHVDISYAGSISDLQQALTAQGLVLRQTNVATWELYDGSMVLR
jgi:hypothetical protein